MLTFFLILIHLKFCMHFFYMIMLVYLDGIMETLKIFNYRFLNGAL